MIIELDKISKHYQLEGIEGKREVLSDISLTIHPGDALAVIGPSGCGKSTLLNILGTLDSPSSGIVRFNGKEVNNMNEKLLAEIRNKHIGFVFQLHHLLPQLSLIENVLLPVMPQKDQNKRKAAAARAMELLESVGLVSKTLQRPGQLSVGECQRAAVVRALINEPGLILADEPTGSLDEDSAELMGDLLSDIHKKHNIAMVVVTHSPGLANKMDIVYKLSHGNLKRNPV
ncbi:MAG: ABC transporter ATP-binding protein [Bacteroidales bacterium]|nr:ABC transporter ATP-binding protein [Bacteroidales bacterium]